MKKDRRASIATEMKKREKLRARTAARIEQFSTCSVCGTGLVGLRSGFVGGYCPDFDNCGSWM